MKRTIIALCFLAAGTFCSVNAAEAGKTNALILKPSDLFTNSIVAKGKGVSVSRSLLDEALVNVKSSAAARGQTIPPEYLKMYERQLLQRLIQVQLLNAKATEADKATGKELATQRLEEIKQRSVSEEALDQQLKAVGLTRAELLTKMTEEATAEAVAKRELKTNVTNEEVKKFYDDNPAKFEQPEMAQVLHVLLSTKDPADQNPDPSARRDLPEDKKQAKHKQMEDILKRARAGEDFSKLVKEYSEDPGAKENNGEYIFSRDDQFVPEFKAAAFSLTTNQISDIVTTLFGYHIIKLIAKPPARKATLEDEVSFTPAGYIIIKQNWKGPPEFVKTAAKLSHIIRQKLELDQQQKQAPEFMDKLMKEADVQILDEDLKMPPIPKEALAPGAPPSKPPSK